MILVLGTTVISSHLNFAHTQSCFVMPDRAGEHFEPPLRDGGVPVLGAPIGARRPRAAYNRKQNLTLQYESVKPMENLLAMLCLNRGEPCYEEGASSFRAFS